MGMMGRFSKRDQDLLGKVIKGVATHDISSIVEAVLSLGEFHDKPDPVSYTHLMGKTA